MESFKQFAENIVHLKKVKGGVDVVYDQTPSKEADLHGEPEVSEKKPKKKSAEMEVEACKKKAHEGVDIDEAHQQGDKIRITTARTKGSKSHNIVVSKHLGGDKYEGQILDGDSAGFTIVGNKIKESEEETMGKSYKQFIDEMLDTLATEDHVEEIEMSEEEISEAGWDMEKMRKDAEDRVNARMKKTTKGTRYGGSNQKDNDEEGEDDEGTKGKKRGKYGARQRGGKTGVAGGTNDHHLNLPTKSVYFK